MTKAIFNIFCSLCGRCFLRFSRQGFDRLFDITSLSHSLVNENPKNTVDKDKYKDSPSDTFNVLQHNYDFFPCCTGYERFSGHRVITSLVSIKNCYSSRISSFFMSCFVFLFSLLSIFLFFFFFGMYLLSLWLICSYSRDSLVHVSFNPTASQSPRCYCKFCKVIFLLSYLF